MLSESFNEMENISCSKIQGAMYGFPRLYLSEKAIQTAENMRVSPDYLYCLDLLNETGIMTIPGSGFRQKEGEYHLRITNLVCPSSEMKNTLNLFKEFNTRFHQKYK